jgi:hypothetical protein
LLIAWAVSGWSRRFERVARLAEGGFRVCEPALTLVREAEQQGLSPDTHRIGGEARFGLTHCVGEHFLDFVKSPRLQVKARYGFG